MTFQTEHICRDIRNLLDLNTSSDALVYVEDEDTLRIEDIIRSSIPDAIRGVEMSAPLHLLESGHNFDGSVCWNEDGSGRIILPDDFMRLIVFRMSDWKQPVYTAITEDDANYKLQTSHWGGIRGNVERPVAAIVLRPEGKMLEFWSSKTKVAKVEQSVYLPFPKFHNDGIEICERCYRAVTYYAAGLTQRTLGMSDAATVSFDTAKSLML